MVKGIPHWLEKKLDPSGLDQIREAIFDVEKTTSGEIVPMIVRRSSVIGHVPVLLFCVFSLFFFLFDIEVHQAKLLGTSSRLWLILDAAVFVIVSSLLSRCSFVQRRLTSQEDLEAQVATRAEVEFYEAELDNTEGATGVLIFLSMMERQVVVLADKAIAARLPKDIWDGVVQILLDGARKNDLASGFARAIRHCGELLHPHFPIQVGDKNELGDNLIIKD
ncbi:MAG: TPM domain-containing protein [Oligoflexales bacterium]